MHRPAARLSQRVLHFVLRSQHVWAKRGEALPNPDADQRIHMDWPNNSLVCPAPLAAGGGAVTRLLRAASSQSALVTDCRVSAGG